MPRKTISEDSSDDESTTHRSPSQANVEAACASAAPCCIARKVTKSEYSQSADAIAAMDKEWENLRTAPRPDPEDKGIGTWDEDKVMEAKDARLQAQKQGNTAHFGSTTDVQGTLGIPR